MATLKGQSIAASYQDLVKRADTYSQTGTNIELMDDSGDVQATGLYLESGAVTDNVGIGRSPTEILDIYAATGNKYIKVETGASNSAAGIKLIGGTGDQSRIYFGDSGDADIGRIVYEHNNNAMAFTTNNAEAMRIDSSGNVGIGVTPDDEWDSFTVLQIGEVGAIFADTDGSGAGSGVTISANTYYDSRYEYLIDASDEASRYTQENGTHQFFTAPAGTHANPITFTERMRIDSSGNVGIGTAAPEGKFHVDAGDAGSVTASVNADEMIVETDTDGGISVLSPDANWGALSFGSPGADVNTLIASNYNSGNPKLRIYVGGESSGDMKMIINSSGNVGIGETAPATLLEMSSTAPYITLHNTTEEDSDGNRESKIIFKGEKADTTEHTLAQIWVMQQGSADNYDGLFRISTNTSSGGADNLVAGLQLDSDSNVGVLAGNLVIGTAGKGISFAATSDAGGMTSEILDDYEEGTFTATAVCSTSGTITLSPSIDLCSYIKIGRLVTVYGEIVVGSVSSPVGSLTIEGLPFTSETSSERNKRSAASIRSSVWSSSVGSTPHGMIIGAESKIRVYRFDGTNTQADLAGYCQANTEITFSCTYEATD